jgi:hypothetical protein
MAKKETLAVYPETSGLMHMKSCPVTKLAQQAKCSEATIYRMRRKKAVCAATGDKVIALLNKMPDKRTKQFVPFDDLTAPLPGKIYMANIEEPCCPDSIGNIVFPGVRRGTPLPCEKTEDQIERMWAYNRLTGRC